MATIYGTGVDERINQSGTALWDGTNWVLVSLDGTTDAADVVFAGGGDDLVGGGDGDDQVAGEQGNDVLVGGSGNDLLDGGLGDDYILGGLGNDKLLGQQGWDILIGRFGADILDGGARGDLFVYESASDSEAGANDRFARSTGDIIVGFTSAFETLDPLSQDKFDLRPLIDRIGVGLAFSDTSATAFGIWYSTTANATIVRIDTSGDGAADMAMKIKSVETLSASDFLTDATFPTIVATSYGNNYGTLAAGETVRLKVTFSEVVFVGGTGLPSLTLNTGGTANYLLGSGRNTLVFQYTVNSGENAADLAIDALNLNGSTIRDAGRNDADLSGATTNPTGQLRVDTLAPYKPQIDLKAAFDTGASKNDDITSIAAPLIGGTAEQNATIEVFDGKVVLGVTTSNASGIWRLVTPDLAEGTHRLRAFATDEAGNRSEVSDRLTLEVDTTPPAPPAAHLANDTGASAVDSVTSDPSIDVAGLEPGATVEYSTDGGATWSSNVIPQEGGNTVLVRQVDVAGNQSVPADTINFILDTIPPSAPVIRSFVTNYDTTTLFGLADPNFEVGVYDGATFQGMALADGSGDWSLELTSLGLAEHQFSATVSDAAGNVGASDIFSVLVTRVVLDLSSLTVSEGFIIQGDEIGDHAGYGVSSAGDVNGDGFDDLIVGAPNGDDGGTDAGEAYVVFGSSSIVGANVSGTQVIDLTSLANAQGFIIQGDREGDRAGWSVSAAGDVNGDGFDDIIVGAPNGDDGGTGAGEAYVVFGSGTGFGRNIDGRQVIDLTSLTAAQGFIVQGDSERDQEGWSVSSAGDVNGDGFDDLIVGARLGDDGGTDAGEAYVVFGSGTGFGGNVGGRQVIDLTSLTAAQGFIIQGDQGGDLSGRDGDLAGRSVSSAGDVNGDGLDDLIVGARNGNDGGDWAGEAYVVFGSSSIVGANVSGRQVIDLTSLTPAQGFIIQGDTIGDQAGWSVSSAGDVNGDGFDDVIVGARNGNDGGDWAGEAYVVFGSGMGFGSNVGGRQVIDLTSLTAAEGFIIQGDDEHDMLGSGVSSAGDVNGDGFDDLIVGAPYGGRWSGGSYRSGESYLVFGSGTGFGNNIGGRQVIDLTSLPAAQGFIIAGDGASDAAGWSVSSAGDLNGDGFDDFLVGVPHGDDGGSEAGEAYVVYGSAFGLSNASIVKNGTASADLLIGGLGNDMLTGNGGADIFRGGRGDDIFGVSDANFREINGGSGRDTLRLDGSGLVLDFSTLLTAAIESVEVIDLTGSGDNTLILDLLDLFQISDDTSDGITRLTIDGDAGDTVGTFASGWIDTGTTSIEGETYEVFQKGQAQLIVNSAIDMSGIAA